MTKEEALARIKTGNFNSGHGFDMQLLVDAVGTIGEMFKSGQISEVVRCEDCRENNQCSIQFKFAYPDNPGEWFCAYGKRK